MNKVVRDGLVAVLYSPSYGAGWYTWNKECPDMIFDPTVVHYVLEEKFDEARAYSNLKWPDAYIGSNVENLEIAWLEEGVQFRIDEYDGNESIVTKEQDDWFVA